MVLSSHGTIEYVEESAFATLPTNPAMLWIGIVQKAVIASKHKNQERPHPGQPQYYATLLRGREPKRDAQERHCREQPAETVSLGDRCFKRMATH